MNKHDIILDIASTSGNSYKVCKTIINIFLESVKTNINRGEHISINGFGKWYIKEYMPRIIYNPNQKIIRWINKKTIPKFKPSKNFRIAIID